MQRAAKARVGWANEERSLMWDEVRKASEEGETLKRAFDSISQKTGRKPNSIRNYYYQSLKEQGAPEELQALRARPFVPFDSDEIHALLRTVLTERARGVSVRACVQAMANGDRSLALRYQNKYRSILKSRPDRIEAVVEELRSEGIDCPNPYDTLRMSRAQPQMARGGDPSTQEVLSALRQMLEREEARGEMRHREEIDRMTVRCDLLRLELARREELLLEAQAERQAALAGAMALAETCKELLGAQGVKLAKNLRASLEAGLEQVQTTLFDEDAPPADDPSETGDGQQFGSH
jgi:hypothetical protein